MASEGPPYQDLREFGWLVKNTASAWERVLLDVVDHLDEYKAEAAREPYLFGLAQGVEGCLFHAAGERNELIFV